MAAGRWCVHRGDANALTRRGHDQVRTTATATPIRMVVVAIAVLTTAVVTAPATPGGAATPYCGITWGSLPKSNSLMSQAPVTNVRAGQHTCFDRLVVDLRAAPAPGYFVGYVSQVVEDGSGRPVPLRGGAFLHVSVLAPGHDSNGTPTYSPPNRAEAVDVSGFRTFRQVAFAGDFEGATTLGLGVRARLPFRVFALAGPGGRTRLVIDVAHRWSGPHEAARRSTPASLPRLVAHSSPPVLATGVADGLSPPRKS